MTNHSINDLAILLLRVSLGVMFITHSVVLKYMIYTLEGTAAYFVSLGLPGFLAYVVFWMEAIGGLMLLTGVASRWVAAALLPVMIGAVWAHAGFGWVFSNDNGGWEYPLYLTLLTLVQVMLGDGKFALANHIPFKNFLLQIASRRLPLTN